MRRINLPAVTRNILAKHPRIPGLSRDLATNPEITSISELEMFILDPKISHIKDFHVTSVKFQYSKSLLVNLKYSAPIKFE